MKKNIILIIAVLVLAAALLAGCSAYPGSGDGYQRGGNAGNANEDGGYYGIRGNGNGNYGGGRRAGDGYCLPEATYTPPSAPAVPAPDSGSVPAGTEGFGAIGALSDNDLTLAGMLTYAIQDEYLLRAEYAYIADTFGSFRPFNNIIRAEEQHIGQLLELFTAYGIEAPADAGSDHVAAVSGLTEAYRAVETAEANNIAMYDAFLKQDLPADVRFVFESLKSASESHLAAFRAHL